MEKDSNKLIYGIGVKDVDYQTQVFKGRDLIWFCPFYSSWKNLLQRSYSENWKTKYPAYRDCYTETIWHKLSNYKAWMQVQDWEGKQLDKDILFPGNKIYGPDTCVFVDQKVNKFITDRAAYRGELPIGVTKYHNKYKACCGNVETGEREYLGLFYTAKEAHQAWLAFKLSQAHILAAEQTDPRVAAALIDRYENYSKYFDQGT